MFDLCAIGDAMIDFTPVSEFERRHPVYQCNVGGTVCNLVVAASKLGLRTMFVGKVGSDCMGDLIRTEMELHKVDLSGYVEDQEHFTTQSFVTLGENGERSFSFSRRYGADIFLETSEIAMEQIMNSHFIHVSGMSMTDDPVRRTTFAVLKEARRRNKIVTIDVNYREPLWKSREEMITVIRESLPYVSLYKSSDDEAMLLTGENTVEQAAEGLHDAGCGFVLISCGARGCYYSYAKGKGQVPSYCVNAVDTTGAGDCFFAGFLYQMRKEKSVEEIPEEKMIEMLRFANASGALATRKRGGVAGAPSVTEIEACMDSNKILYL